MDDAFRSSRSSLSHLHDLDLLPPLKKKVIVWLRATGDAPILKQQRYKVGANERLSKVVDILRERLKKDSLVRVLLFCVFFLSSLFLRPRTLIIFFPLSLFLSFFLFPSSVRLCERVLRPEPRREGRGARPGLRLGGGHEADAQLQHDPGLGVKRKERKKSS